jgi:hypothetical protein
MRYIVERDFELKGPASFLLYVDLYTIIGTLKSPEFWSGDNERQ